MPLDKSGTRRSVSANIRELKASGYADPKQRVAIALDTQRKALGVSRGAKRKRPSARRRSR